jgi:hypothetical protein
LFDGLHQIIFSKRREKALMRDSFPALSTHGLVEGYPGDVMLTFACSMDSLRISSVATQTHSNLHIWSVLQTIAHQVNHNPIVHSDNS